MHARAAGPGYGCSEPHFPSMQSLCVCMFPLFPSFALVHLFLCVSGWKQLEIVVINTTKWYMDTYFITSSIGLYISSIAPSAPSGVAVSEATDSIIRVTWTAPPGDIELLGYQVSFERLPGWGCDSLHNATKNITSTITDDTVTGLSGLSAYRISVAAMLCATLKSPAAEQSLFIVL